MTKPLKAFTVKFSNQNINMLVTGEVSVYATNGKQAVKLASERVVVKGGAWFIAKET